MNEKVWPKLIVAMVSTVLLICLNYALPRRETRTATIGEFQQISYDHSRGRVIISNATGFQRIGECVVFESFGMTRIPVVILVKSEPVEDSCDEFEVICEGVIRTKREGDPIDPPFVYAVIVTKR